MDCNQFCNIVLMRLIWAKNGLSHERFSLYDLTIRLARKANGILLDYGYPDMQVLCRGRRVYMFGVNHRLLCELAITADEVSSDDERNFATPRLTLINKKGELPMHLRLENIGAYNVKK